MRRFRVVSALLASSLGVGCLSAAPQAAQSVPVLKLEVVKRYPHDPAAFTQGLVYDDGGFYEGTGLYGKSELRRVDLETGKVERRQKLPDSVFGEGLARVGERLVQLTWTNRTAYVWDRKTFSLQRTFPYLTEGWGLTYDGKSLILSDGSAFLYFYDPTTYAVQKRVRVTAAGSAVDRLNELEFVSGSVYANVWTSDRIARIDPATGRVTAWLDASALVRAVGATDPDDVLNGIAWDAAGKRLFVTGKRWPTLFEVRVAGER